MADIDKDMEENKQIEINKVETDLASENDALSPSVLSVKMEQAEVQQIETKEILTEQHVEETVAPEGAVPPLKIMVKMKPRSKKVFRPVYSKLRTQTKCHLCNHYIKRASIGRHIKYVHGEMLLQCTICKRAFGRPDSARNHLALHHQIGGANSKDYIVDVRKGDLPEENIPPLRRQVLKRPSASKRGYVLPTILAYNCYDCDETFHSTAELFAHCAVHRYTEDGKRFRTLKPQKGKFRRNF